MIVYKFGGASVKDASAVRNVVKIIKESSNNRMVVVVSAMGKMTNTLEGLYQKKCEGKFDISSLDEFKNYHVNIASDLFPKDHSVFNKMNSLFEKLELVLSEDKPVHNKAKEYDKIICFGELLSTTIVESFCLGSEIDCCWIDARTIITTDDQFQYANVNWKETQKKADKLFNESDKKVFVTQGFIGADHHGNTTSLGREGSDFSAAIFAYVTNAISVTIWKDVPGMLNADPKFFKETTKLDAISYREAIELSYYGASVIHPKTVKPLENKKIPLYIKSFENDSTEGTVIQKSAQYDALVPSFIFKENQLLISISPKDFSFIEEEQLGFIFQAIFKAGIKLNLMQNSALSLTLVFDQNEEKLKSLIQLIEKEYSIKFNLGLKLLNIRHYNEDTIRRLTDPYEVLIRQQTRANIRMVVKDL